MAKVFQSTPSVWRETHRQSRRADSRTISIHSLRVEGDKAVELGEQIGCISIHSLRVEGDIAVLPVGCQQQVFQSTPSV